MQRHLLFGLTIDSAIPLPDVPYAEPVAPAEVRITLGAVPRPVGTEPVGLHIIDDGAVLNIPEAGRYLITDGRAIVVEPSHAASERDVRLYLLGSAFGAILHQRRLFPLHANVIDFGGVAIAFTGHSGAGKSTLASWFHDQGHRILGDDVCVIRSDTARAATVAPGLARIRLWGDALEASGRRADDYAASFDDMDKYDVPIPVGAEPLPLAAIYALQANEQGEEGTIRRLTGIAALDVLVANTYRGGYLPLLGGVQHHLAQSLALARDVPIFQFSRRWGHEIFAAEAALAAAHVRGVIAARSTDAGVDGNA